MKRYIILFAAIFAISTSSAQLCSVRVNALSALTATADVGVDVPLSDNITLDISARYNPLRNERISLSHATVELGAKYWLYENFVGHFVASHLGYTNYNVGDRTSRYDGSGYTFALSCGYSWILATRWSMAVEAGLGLCYSEDLQSDPTVGDWDDEYYYTTQRLTLIPSRLGVTFSYLF